MTFASEFHAFVRSRGDGLHQKIQDLLDRTATSSSSEVFVRHDGMLQSGPNPRSDVPVSGNIASFPWEERRSSDKLQTSK